MIGPSAPVSDVDRFAQTVADLNRRIGDLERTSGRISTIRTFTVVRRGGGVADTLGAGVNFGRYQITDGKCFFSIFWAFGPGAPASANAGITTFDAPVPFGPNGTAFQHVASGNGIQGAARLNFEVVRDGTNNGFHFYTATSQVSSTVPAAVTYSDSWEFNGWYWV